jgi:hypothetical protein
MASKKEDKQMGSKEVRNWRSEEALERYRMIMPLLDPEIDNAKRCMSECQAKFSR